LTIKNGIFHCAAAAILAGGSISAGSASESGWAPLFNGRKFDGWYTYLPSTGKNYENKLVGGLLYFFNGPDNIWPRSPEEPVEKIAGYFRSLPVTARLRSRFFITLGGPHVHGRSLEFQLQETDVGDLWLLDGSKITTKVETVEMKPLR
jgi:hypothetical protein